MALTKDLREFVECLNKNDVEYLIVGALAVSWHGYPRYSADIDLFVRPDSENAVRVIRALHQFGFQALAVTAEDFSTPDQIVQVGREPNRIDIMTSISGVSFEEAWTGRVDGHIDGIAVSIIGKQQLM